MVSAEPFSHETGTLRCLQKEIATYRHWYVSLWRDLDDVSHCRMLFPDKTEWRLISATLCGWRRCFVADKLWFMTRIREEEEWIFTETKETANCYEVAFCILVAASHRGPVLSPVEKDDLPRERCLSASFAALSWTVTFLVNTTWHLLQLYNHYLILFR